MPLFSGAPLNGTAFLVTGTDLACNFGNDTVYKAICVFYSDGSTQFAMTNGLSTLNGNTLVSLTSPVTRAIDGTAIRISWMPVHRFASDSLISEWVTDQVAQTQLSVVSLEDLIPGA